MEHPSIRCYKCAHENLPLTEYCSRCGTQIIEEDAMSDGSLWKTVFWFLGFPVSLILACYDAAWFFFGKPPILIPVAGAIFVTTFYMAFGRELV